MGFSNTLKSNAVNEWKDYYLDYDKLRTKIKNRDFRTLLYNEVNKINNFYFLLERKAVDEKNTLFNDIIAEFPGESINEIKNTTGNVDIGTDKPEKRAETDQDEEMDFDAYKSKKIKEDSESNNTTMIYSEGFSSLIPLQKGYTRRKKEKHITEFLHSLIKIKAYRDLNATGLLKLAKRYANINKNDVFYTKFNEKLKETYFYKSKRIDSIRNAVKKLYKQLFAKDEPEKAKNVFKRLGKGTKTFDIFYLLSGLLIGSSITVSLWSYMPSSDKYKFMSGVNNVFYGFIFFGLCLKAFKNFSINYKFIFNFDVVSSMNNSTYLLTVSFLLFFNSIIYLISTELEDYTIYLQLLLPIIFLFNPLDILYLNSRIYLISVYARGILLPMSTIRFRHFYFVDILQSFRYPFEVIIGSFLDDNRLKQEYPLMAFSLFPIVRFLQCMRRYYSSKLLFPHIANAAKYSLVLIAIFFEIFEKINQSKEVDGKFLTLKYTLKTLCSTMPFLWDVFVDWVIPRNRYMFPQIFYIFAISTNLIVRFYWLISLISVHFLNIKQSIENPILLSIAEILRRSIWTVIRVEVEHLNNCDELKLKKAINLTAGELFYKKDIDENYQNANDHIMTETEFETEMEDNSGSKDDSKVVGVETTTEDDSAVEYEDQYEDNERETSESHDEFE